MVQNTNARPAYYEQLTPNNCAMLLIDHQVGTMGFGITDIDALSLKNRRC